MAAAGRFGTSTSQGRATPVALGRSCRKSCAWRAETGPESSCTKRPALGAAPFGPVGCGACASRMGRSARPVPFECRAPRLLAITLSLGRSNRAPCKICAQLAMIQDCDGPDTLRSAARASATGPSLFVSFVAPVTNGSSCPEPAMPGSTVPAHAGGSEACYTGPAQRAGIVSTNSSRHVDASHAGLCIALDIADAKSLVDVAERERTGERSPMGEGSMAHRGGAR